MSHARLSSAAAILFGLSLAFITIKLPATSAVMSALMTENHGMLSLLMGDRLVKTALAVAVFGVTVGLVFFLCSWLFVRRPLALAAQQLRDAGTHGADVRASEVLDILSGITPLRSQLAPLRRQFAVAHLSETASLAQPAGAFLSPDVLRNAISPAWLTNIIAGGLLLFAIMAVFWGVATGANAQTVNQLDPNFGHAEGLLIGLQSGGVACLLALAGAFACFALSAAGRGLSGQTADDFLSAVTTAAYVTSPRQTHHDPDSAALVLAGATPHTDLPGLKPYLETMVSSQTKLGSNMTDVMSAIKAQTDALQSAMQSYTTTLQEQEQRRDLKLSDQRVAEAALMQETAMALQELKAALVAFKSAPAAQTMMPTTAVSQRLSSAMRSLRQATTDQAES
jgi:hypothetical protein